MRRKESIRLCVVLCAAFLFIAGAVFLSGAAQRETTPYVPLLSDADGRYSVLAVGSVGTDAVAVFSGSESSALLRCNADGVQAQVNLQIPLDWAAVREAEIVLKSDGLLLQYDAFTLRETAQSNLPWPADDILNFACDQNGTMYAVLSQSRNSVQIRLPDGSGRTESLPGEIRAFSAVLQGVWVWTEGDLRMLSRAERREFAWPVAPLAAFDEGAFLDRDGLFCTCEGTEVFPLFRCEQDLYEGLNYCLDAEGCLLIADGVSVLRYDRAGELLEGCELAGTPEAICANGAIFRQEDGFYYAELASLPQEPEPPQETPEPGPTPGEEIEPPPLQLEDNCIIVQYGMTVQELRELFKPEAVEIRDRSGRLLTSGRLATGMTANDFVIVLEGDVNGSGTITESDLREAIGMYLQQEGSGPQFRAADLTDDGTIDAYDLLLLSKLIRELKEREA